MDVAELKRKFAAGLKSRGSSPLVELFRRQMNSHLVKSAMNQAVEKYHNKWVTIGASNHEGGTPVELDEAGHIVKGPKALAGQHVSSLRPKFPTPGDKGGEFKLESESAEPPATKPKQEALFDKLPAEPKKLETLGMKRADLPQVASDDKPEFFDYLKQQGIGVSQATIPAGQLKGVQEDFNAEKVSQMADSMRGGKMKPSRLLASNDGYIIDGHHRWRAENAVSPDKQVDVDQVDLSAKELLEKIEKFPKTFKAGTDEDAGPRNGKKGKPAKMPLGPGLVKPQDLKVDPHRFQYKISGIDAVTGTTKELKEVRKFNPMLAGQLLVWQDPDNGETYVVNGHHRHELATRTGYNEPLSVYHVEAKTANEARAAGALADIAEGRGTAIDSAKFIRDSGRTIQDLEDTGISLSGKIAKDGAVLSKISPKLFQDLTNGITTEDRALAIGKHVSKPEHQDQLYKIIKAKEDKSDKSIPNNVVEEMAREMEMAGSRKSSSSDLFGDFEDEKSNFLERGELKAGIRKLLGEEKTAFKAVSKDRRASRLQAEGKNVLDTEGNKRKAQTAAEALGTFDKLVNTKGPLSEAINQAATEYGNNPRSKKRILEDLHGKIAGLVEQEFRGTGAPDQQGSPETAGPADSGASGSGQTVEKFSRRMKDQALAYIAQANREKYFRSMVGEVIRFANVEWKENLHPRATDGKFGSGGAGPMAKLATAGQKKPPAKKSPGYSADVDAFNQAMRKKPVTRKPEVPEEPAKKPAGDNVPDHLQKPDSLASHALFSEQERALPASAKQQAQNREELYAKAPDEHKSFDNSLNHGKGLDAAIGANVIRPNTAEEFAKAIDSPGPSVIIAGLKGANRAEEKVKNKYGGDWSRLKDVIRATVAVQSKDDIPHAVESLRREMGKKGWTMAEAPNNKIESPTEDGYRDLSFIFQSKEGMLAEIQVNTKKMIKAKEGEGHKMYEQTRVIREAIDSQKRKATPEEAKTLAELGGKMKSLYNEAWG